ncbi:hypothetical protein FHG87_024658 [Trinorchestia longiramus]|nr:hypothetical protein FHG87_024658 [Trinorchestia longiramus]
MLFESVKSKAVIWVFLDQLQSLNDTIQTHGKHRGYQKEPTSSHHLTQNSGAPYTTTRLRTIGARLPLPPLPLLPLPLILLPLPLPLPLPHLPTFPRYIGNCATDF